MPTCGSEAISAGETAAIVRASTAWTSSSATGGVEKYENLAVSGIISPLKRAARSSTVNLDPAVSAAMTRIDCNKRRGKLGIGGAKQFWYRRVRPRRSLRLARRCRAAPRVPGSIASAAPGRGCARKACARWSTRLACRGRPPRSGRHLPRVWREYRKLVAAGARRKARPGPAHRFARFPLARGPALKAQGRPVFTGGAQAWAWRRAASKSCAATSSACLASFLLKRSSFAPKG